MHAEKRSRPAGSFAMLFLAAFLPAAPYGQTCTVTNANDAGAGSLREKIQLGNAGACPVISFNLAPGRAVFTIALSTVLPDITRSMTIDATTQPGFSQFGERIRLINIGTPGWGFLVAASGVAIKGFIVEGFTDAVLINSSSGNDVISNNTFIKGNRGILAVAGANNNVFSDNKIGTGAGGTALGNAIEGISVQSNNNSIRANTIAFNARDGILVRAPGAGNALLGNGIFRNGPGAADKAIDLDGGGGNRGKAAPTLDGHAIQGASVVLTGRAGAGNRVQVFVSDGGPQNALRTAADVKANPSGAWSATIASGQNYDPTRTNFYVATATDGGGNTSELSGLRTVPPVQQAGDQVRFSNANASGDIGILLDGNLGGNVNDLAFITGATGVVQPGNVTPGTRNELIAYQAGRPPRLLEGVPWTSGQDIVTVGFANEMPIDLTVWMIEPPSAERQAQVTAARAKVNQIWNTERMGTRINGFQVVDKTADPAGPAFQEFTCGLAADMHARIGFIPGRVNLYYVNTVDFGNGPATTNGVFCGDNTIALGRFASDHLAAHELGHSFNLQHVFPPNFDETNVMHNASDTRQFFTEGQTFRANVDPVSSINATYNLRPGLATRPCDPFLESATDDCPALQRRIFADGAFPPNSVNSVSSVTVASATSGPGGGDAIRAVLMQDCGTGAPAAKARPETDPRAAAALFLEALKNGLSPSERAGLAHDAAEEYPRLAGFMEGGSLSSDAFVRQRVESAERGRRERALNALGRMRNPEILGELKKIARQPGLPADLRKAVEKAIAAPE